MAVSFGMLEQMLYLPEGHRICGLRQSDSFSDQFEIMVEGPSLAECERAPRVSYQVSVTDHEELVRRRTFAGKFEKAI